MAERTVPKKIIRLLERRMELSQKLMATCGEVDEYCRKIGVDFDDPDAALQTDVCIYCEADGAYASTLKAIKKLWAFIKKISALVY